MNPTAPPDNSCHCRIAWFFEKIKDEKRQFNDAKEVHQYLVTTLKETEDFFGIKNKRMCITSLVNFTYYKKMGLYYFAHKYQTTVIREDGAYATYNNKTRFKADCISVIEKETERIIVNMANTAGHAIFPTS